MKEVEITRKEYWKIAASAEARTADTSNDVAERVLTSYTSAGVLSCQARYTSNSSKYFKFVEE